MNEILPLLVVAALAWFWWDGQRAKEAAVANARAACRRHQLQFLDETVHLRRLGLARDSRGQVRLRRHYRFEFTVAGEDRREGGMEMLGPVAQRLHLDLPVHTLHEWEED